MRNMEKTVNGICSWIDKKVAAAHAHGVVVGLSGGVDSGLTATLAVRALGKDRVFGVIMPCQSDPSDERDGLKLAQWLGIEYDRVDLEPVFDSFVQVLGDLPASGNNVLGRGNLKARMRMSALYFRAAQCNCLVAGTGNRSEIMLGYYTKYGDGGVDMEPIGDLYKSEVRQLAGYLGVPESIVTKAPSAGLWPGQTDEQELGMSYDTVERILRNLSETGGEVTPKTSICTTDELERVMTLVSGSEHKRRMPPICELSD